MPDGPDSSRGLRPAVAGRGALVALVPFLVFGTTAALRGQDGEPADSGAASAEAPTRGLYTEAQAERGEAVFRSRCSTCHLKNQFRGDAFWFQWKGRSALDLVEQLRATMPQDSPGGLPAQQYVDVAAYLFRLNRYPEGEEELPLEDAALRVIRIPEEASGG